MPLSDLLAPTNGQAMRYNGTVWVPATLLSTDLQTPNSTWTGLPYATGWADEGSVGMFGGQYHKSHDGHWVELRGVAKRNSGSSTTIATLPVGFRPPYTIWEMVQVYFGAMALQITTTGLVTTSAINSGGAADATQWTRFDGVKFAMDG